MRDHSKHIELSREEAVAAILDRCKQACTGAERVSVEDSYGRVIAQNIVSDIQVPNCLTCCLDSIAVRWSDFERGMPQTSEWMRGVDWQFANTGVAMPEGFDTAIVIEHVELSEDEQGVCVNAMPSQQFAGTKPVGSNLKLGDLLAAAGDVVTPDIAARIASGNVVSVPVRRKPRVAFIPTGNELVKPGSAEVGMGKNIETNSLLVRGRVEEWGGTYVPMDIVPDNPQLIRQAVLDALKVADIVVLNAGSSKGSDDWSVEQLEDMGDIICHQTNHGPGHHSSFAVIEGTPIVGISGPPHGASLTLGFYLRPVIRHMLGLDPAPEKLPVRLVAPFPGSSFVEKIKQIDSKNLPGETRPSEATDENKKPFFSLKLLNVKLADDGTLIGTPVGDRYTTSGTAQPNAYYMLQSGHAAQVPEAGDIVLVELR